jgi:GDP-D-mannose 3', 5'-epimerase
MNKIVVLGAGGFIGSHLVKSLKQAGNYVIGADLKNPEFGESHADEFYIADLRDLAAMDRVVPADTYEVYQLAADMGGAGYIFTGDNDSAIMLNSVSINVNLLNVMIKKSINRVFYSSSACIYPQENQTDSDNPDCRESTAYPANPDSEYGWEKLFSERLFLSHAKNNGFVARIARLHNVYGPYGVWNNGKEKVPAALCRKIALSTGSIDVWGDGNQTRSFLYIDECIEGIQRLMASDCNIPVNLGSDRMISINELAGMIARIAGKQIAINHIPGPLGVAGRNSNNDLIKEKLGWAPKNNLEYGLENTYRWIVDQIEKS